MIHTLINRRCRLHTCCRQLIVTILLLQVLSIHDYESVSCFRKEDKELNQVQKKKKTKDVRERVKVGDPGLNVLLASEGLGLVALHKVGGGQRAGDHDDVEPGWPP